MSKRIEAVVLMAEGFEEMELTITADLLRRAGFHVVLATLADDAAPVRGSRGMAMVPDHTVAEVLAQAFDVVVLPGGLDGTRRLAEDERVVALLQRQNEAGRHIGAICAAPLVLLKAGLATGRMLTSHPSVRDQLAGTEYREDRVVIDRNLITSRGPGTTFEFAYALIEALDGKKKVDVVNAGVMARLS